MAVEANTNSWDRYQVAFDARLLVFLLLLFMPYVRKCRAGGSIFAPSHLARWQSAQRSLSECDIIVSPLLSSPILLRSTDSWNLDLKKYKGNFFVVKRKDCWATYAAQSLFPDAQVTCTIVGRLYVGHGVYRDHALEEDSVCAELT